MEKFKKKKTVSLVALALLFVGGLGGAVWAALAPSSAEASVVVTQDGEIAEAYAFGEKISIPKATLSFNGKSVPATAVVVYPDGSAYVKDEITLDREGQYTIRYRATIEEKVHIAEKNFTVSKTLYSVTKQTSSVAYGTYNVSEHNPENLKTNDGREIAGSVSGVQVSLAAGDTFTYNKAIDLSGMTAADLLLTLCVTPERVGLYDVSDFDILLTDAYDNANVVTVNVKNSPDGVEYANSYLKAKTEGQALTGHEWNYNAKHVANSYGYPVRLNLAGLLNYGSLQTIADNSVNLSFDYASRALHSTVRQASSSSTVICDFDDSEDFTNLWSGFTTGECFLSVRSNSYVGSAFHFVITKIGSQDISDFSFTDRGTASIEVDLDGYEPNALPEAEVGSPYKLFAPASCRSPYFGELAVTSHVYANYLSSNRYELEVKNGAFTPDAAGIYSIVYETVDPFGKVGGAVYTVKAVSSMEEITITLPAEGICKSVAVAGELVELNAPTLTGGSGRLTVKIFVECDETREEISQGFWRPQRAGNYKIVLEATDYCNRTAVYNQAVKVESGDKPTFTHDVSLPVCFVSGVEYVLPTLNAYNFTDGTASPLSTTISVEDSTGVRNVRNNKFTPTARTHGEKIKVIYTAKLQNGALQTKEYVVPVVILKEDGFRFDRLIYAATNNVTYAADERGTVVSVDYGVKNASFDFINAIAAQGLEVKFGIPSGGTDFTKFSIVLTDTVNRAESVKFTYRKGTSQSFFSVNGGRESAVSQKFGQHTPGQNVNPFTFRFDEIGGTAVYDATSVQTATVDSYENGDKYTGFSSGRVFVRFEIEDISGNAQVYLMSVNSQTLGNGKRDIVAPQIAVMSDDFGGEKQVGEKLLIARAVAADAVDCTAVVKVTVRDSEGNFVTATDGTVLNEVSCEVDRYVDLTKIGTYSVYYETKDASDNENSYDYIVNVIDCEKPIIVIEGSISNQGKVGKVIKLPAAHATDNVSQELQVYIYVVDINGKITSLSERTFTPERAGIYTVRYWCIDEEGNMQTEEYKITVR